jgi:endogenous inhibitor of DNA gyrase (YacG/DUF329 family)
MSLSNRVEKIEAKTGRAGEPCPLCERRAESVERSPVMRWGFVEMPGDSYTLNCPRCGAPFTIQVVYVSRKEAA